MSEKAIYHADASLFDGYIKRLNNQQWMMFCVIFLLVSFFQYFIIFNGHNNLPLWVIALISIVLISAFIFSIKFRNKSIRKFAGAQYSIINNAIVQTTADGKTRIISFEEIAVVDKRFFGLVVIKGGGWTKINYLKPSRQAKYNLESDTTIFIPSITSNFTTLVTLVKQLAMNAVKL
jgi:magnesium-transporting ATPase (P-type)